MDIEKVNATLVKALATIQQGEILGLVGMDESGEPSKFVGPLQQLWDPKKFKPPKKIEPKTDAVGKKTFTVYTVAKHRGDTDLSNGQAYNAIGLTWFVDVYNRRFDPEFLVAWTVTSKEGSGIGVSKYWKGGPKSLMYNFPAANPNWKAKLIDVVPFSKVDKVAAGMFSDDVMKGGGKFVAQGGKQNIAVLSKLFGPIKK